MGEVPKHLLKPFWEEFEKKRETLDNWESAQDKKEAKLRSRHQRLKKYKQRLDEQEEQLKQREWGLDSKKRNLYLVTWWEVNELIFQGVARYREGLKQAGIEDLPPVRLSSEDRITWIDQYLKSLAEKLRE